MSWANAAIAGLQRGDTVTIRPFGHSMEPYIKSGARVTLTPVGPETSLATGDIVLVRVRALVFLHRIYGMRGEGMAREFQIGNARGHINGWAPRTDIYGRKR